jgi:hypothetical protein
MPLTILHLFPNQLSPKLTPRFLVQQGEIRSQRQARQPRDRPAYPFRLSRRQQPATARTNSKRPIHLNSLCSLCQLNLHPNQIMHRRRRFPYRVPITSSQWVTRKKVDGLHARVESSFRMKLLATFKHSRIPRCPHPNRAQRRCHELSNLPILSKNPLNLRQPSSRNLCVQRLRLEPHPARQPTRMLLPKIALHITIHRSSHFLRLHRIGSPLHQGTPAIILL